MAKLKLSPKQKEVIFDMREKGYGLRWSVKAHFWSYEKGGKIVQKHLPTTTAQSLVGRSELIELSTSDEVARTYRLTPLGQSIDL